LFERQSRSEPTCKDKTAAKIRHTPFQRQYSTGFTTFSARNHTLKEIIAGYFGTPSPSIPGPQPMAHSLSFRPPEHPLAQNSKLLRSGASPAGKPGAHPSPPPPFGVDTPIFKAKVTCTSNKTRTEKGTYTLTNKFRPHPELSSLPNTTVM
jgi:hypothetical protein